MINETLEKLKVCSVCKKALLLSQYYTRKRAGGVKVPRSFCKSCSIKSVVAWGKKNPEKKKCNQAKYSKRHRGKIDSGIETWRNANPDKMQQYAFNGYKKHLERKFGITIQGYDDMYIQQGGRCAICGAHQSELRKRFCVDHCHSSGKVRGLLCDRCNTSIGKFEHNIALLKNAIKYLGDG